MVGVLISIWSVVGGRWLMVGGLWSVVRGWSVGGGFVLRPLLSYITAKFGVLIFPETNKYCVKAMSFCLT